MAIQEESFSQEKKAKTPVFDQQSNTNDEFEVSLRPKDFSGYIGQTEVKKNMMVFAAAAKKRNDPLDHVLFYGPPGLGKTTLANILATEMQANLRVTSGPAFEKPGDLAAILTNLEDGDILFVDEIHRLRLPVEEILYTAMEDFAIDLVIGKGPSARTMRLDVPRFTLIGATTKASMLSGPLRDRFGHVEKLRYYESPEIQEILLRSAEILDVDIDKISAEMLSRSSRRTPRIANRLLRRMRDFAQVEFSGKITPEVVESSLKSLSIDSRGFDRADQEYLHTIAQKFSGGPVGLSTISAAIGEDESTIEDMIEPFLIREGFLNRTPKGRTLTESAWKHIQVKGRLL